MRTTLAKIRSRFLEGFAEELGRWSARVMLLGLISALATRLIG